MGILHGDALKSAVQGIDSEWAVIPGKGLVRIIETAGFGEGLLVVAAIAELANKANHHPEVTVKFDQIEITIFSHDVSGITERDIKLAAHIDKLLEA